MYKLNIKKHFVIVSSSSLFIFFLSVHAHEVTSNAYAAIQRTLNIHNDYKPKPLTNYFNQQCREDFIRPDGSYGDSANLLKKEIMGKGKSRDYTKYFFGEVREIHGLTSICPNFHKMNDDEKLNFWILTMTVIARFESGCNPNAINNKASNGRAMGAYQTPRTENGKSPAWRGPGCKASGPKDYKTPEFQAACAIEILGSHLNGTYSRSGHGKFPSEPGSYWAVLMNQKGQHSNLRFIREFKPCQR